VPNELVGADAGGLHQREQRPDDLLARRLDLRIATLVPVLVLLRGGEGEG
jgi:hypothetical protein